MTFLKGESDAIVDPSQFAIMQANLELTKTFSDKELQGLEAYIHSNSKVILNKLENHFELKWFFYHLKCKVYLSFWKTYFTFD